MNYEAQREERQNKKRRNRRIASAIGAVVFIAVIIFSLIYPPQTWKYYVKKPKIGKIAEGECRVHFLSVGQGDSTIIELPNGKSALIDGGDGAEEHTAYILRYINALGIKKLDYVVATHTDADHTGGLAEVVSVKGAGEVFMPYVSYYANAAFDSFLLAVKQSGTKTTFSHCGITLSERTGNVPFELCMVAPLSKDAPEGEYAQANKEKGNDDKKVNDTSAVMYLDYFGSTVLFCGDVSAEKEKELLVRSHAGIIDCKQKEIKLESVEILKAAHHGSAGSSSEEFIREIGVRDAVISVGKNNAYGHPSTEILSRFKRNGVRVSRTDENGTVVATLHKDGSYTIGYV